ncbi:MAG: DNA polymerase/3'-5' exonuclease PolX [Candidatus Margulisbacteria bacterium]|nr:DNA polymerase/3'-5' exonuclease PolX [Candidatus Margulisiibacteriota bacterium]
MENSEFANIFWDMAEFLELKEDNPFKVRAYRKAAQNIEALSKSVEEIYAKGGLKALLAVPGIGQHIAEKIEEQIKTGKVKAHDQLAKQFPRGFLDLANIPGMGPKTALLLFKKFKIDTPKKLEKAAKAGKLRNIPGMGAKKEENILRGINLKKQSHGRFLLDDATAHAELIVEELKKLKEVKKILPCGSLRRGQETIGDIDILVTSAKPKPIMDAFVKLAAVKNILAHGETKSSVILKNGMQADLRVVPEKSFGSAAHYFTGSKAHNIHIRQLAQKKGWKVSEYGIFKGNKQIGGRTEEEMFTKFGFQFIPPELREMRGEFEAAKNKKIPKLVELKDIKGDLHMHTKATDGSNSIEEMARAAKALGYEYIAITEHTQSTRVAGGLDEKEMLAHVKKIREANKKVKGIEILAGAEVDILPDGRLDYSDEALDQLDIVLTAIHSRFKMPKEEMTERIVSAMENKYANIFVHPTGRLINEREPYEIDMEKVLQAAKKNNVAVEINAHPRRLDLTDIYCMRAKELGVKLLISTDAHSTDQLELMKYGVITARRGWLEKKNVLNTYPLAKLKKMLYASK